MLLQSDDMHHLEMRTIPDLAIVGIQPLTSTNDFKAFTAIASHIWGNLSS
jgi:hypothetical protein